MPDPAFAITGHATILHVKDMPTALAYYRDKLGFAVTFSWEDQPRYVCLCLGDCAIHLNSYVPPPIACLHFLQGHRCAIRSTHRARRRCRRADRRPRLWHARFRRDRSGWSPARLRSGNFRTLST